MKIQKLAVLALVAAGMFFAGGSNAFAYDSKDAPQTDCVDGYYPTLDSEGMPTCEPIELIDPTDEVVISDGECWTNEDGVEACARTFTTEVEPQPIDSTCEVVKEDGTIETTACSDLIAYSGVPIQDGGDLVLMESKSGMEKSFTFASSGTQQDGTLAFLGMFFGLVGAAALALIKNPVAKK